MKIYRYVLSGLVAATLVFGSSLLFCSSVVLAQVSEKAAITTSTPAAAQKGSRETDSGLPPGRQDQFGHASGAVASNSTQQPANSAAVKKHIAGVKYEDRQAGNQQTLDGASKDAAKSYVSTLDGASKDAAKSLTAQNGKQGASSSTQDSKRVNKIDSFTVKQ